MNLEILEELRAELLSLGPLAFHNEDVWQHVCAANTWGSNAIEGNDISRADVDTLILQDTSIGGHPVWEVLETVQHARAFMELFDRVGKPITRRTCRELHDQVMRGVIKGAGRWRTVDLHIKGSLHVPPPADEVVRSMEVWEKDYREGCKDTLPVFELASSMHHGFEAVHPFNGGNGRVGRLLLNLHFLKHDWPPVNIGLADRARYFSSLESAHSGDIGPLQEFLREAMGRSLLTVLDLVSQGEDRLRPMAEMESRGEGFLAYKEHMAEEGRLPALRVGNSWHSSRRALSLFNEHDGRT
ncbi:MAG: Fic family protein [Thermoplasmata archaeon]|nr:MAG: Fic family protein [Thermoplasmata archaeon]